MEGNEYISIQEAVSLSKKHITTIYSAIKKGKIHTIESLLRGRKIKKLLKADIETLFLIDSIGHYSDHIGHYSDSIANNSNSIGLNSDTIETLKTAIEEVLEAKQSQLMKPLEDQALYRCGVLENEVKHLQAEKEVLRQENELLREQVKALPDLQTIQEKEKDLIIQIELERKEKEDL
ncbi:MAG TPA: hypothetical protein PKJ95_05865, partial [Atribacterota bacterium]|nr:hypothetical protein [Atribacterota bacterium]